jgi:hypothetical protein
MAAASRRGRCSRSVSPSLPIVPVFAVLLTAILACPLAGCQRSTTGAGPILKATLLQQYPEYRLYYPGATLISEGGRDAENGPLFYSGATAGAVLGTADSKEQVLAFYERELESRGWQRSSIDNAPTTADLDTRAWRKGPVAFRLALLRRNDPRNPAAGDQFATPFEFTLLADDPRDPRWTKQP